MRTPLCVAVAVALFSAGCSQASSPTAPTSLAANTADGLAATSADLPFKGSLEGTVTVTPLEAPMANVFIAGSGTATHLGRFTVEIPHLVNFATAIGAGTFTFTAANGDQLTGDFTGAADTSTPVFSIVEQATITGGTGRFAHATGGFVARRLYDPAAGTTTGSFEGTITM